MKTNINGKEYSTEAAELLGSRGVGIGVRSFYTTDEHLYRNSEGEYFLYGFASDSIGREKYGLDSSRQIVPVTEAKAREWASDYLKADKYAAIFGEVK